MARKAMVDSKGRAAALIDPMPKRSLCAILRTCPLGSAFPNLALGTQSRSPGLKVRRALMNRRIDETVAVRAYELWEQAGKPQGRDEEFWHLAEQQLLNEDKSSPLRTPDTL